MSETTVNRSVKCCALCRYWNGTLGSLHIQVVPGAMQFRIDTQEKHGCFKKGRGMETSAQYTCPYFRPRYENE